MLGLSRISNIRSGGQTGADRGALDAARDAGVPTCGWCPKGGWAEDCPCAPGLLADYPELKETPSADPIQRTEWNVRDSDATLIICPEGLQTSPGTQATVEFAQAYGKPLLIVIHNSKQDLQRIREWLGNIGGSIELNVAGPRSSENEHVYDIACSIVDALLSDNAIPTSNPSSPQIP